MIATSIISGLCAIAPTIAGWLGGDKAERVTTQAVGMAKTIAGTDDEQAALTALQQNPELAIKFQQAWQSFELGLQQELTKRHQADMQSDSWLSKNIRPLCLLFISIAITVGVYLPEAYVSPAKFTALTDMGVWVYGYYFVGRSTFDKGNVQIGLGSMAKGGVPRMGNALAGGA